MSSHSLLQEIFLTQGSNLGLPHHNQILYHLSHQDLNTGLLTTNLLLYYIITASKQKSVSIWKDKCQIWGNKWPTIPVYLGLRAGSWDTELSVLQLESTGQTRTHWHPFWKSHLYEISHYLEWPDGERNGTPLQYSCLENTMGGGAWWAAVHGVEKSWTRLSDFTFTFHFHALEKEMAPHSSPLAWKIPWMEEPGRLQSTGSLRIGHNWVTSLSLFTLMHWRRKWHPTPVLLPGKSNGRKSLVGCSPRGLSDFPFTFHFHALEKEMATHSSVLAWRIPGMGDPGGLPSMDSHRVGHDWSNLVAAAAEWPE